MSEERQKTPEELAALAELAELGRVKAQQQVEVDRAREKIDAAQTQLNHRLKAMSAIEAQIRAVRARLETFGSHMPATGPEAL